jgi:hypothetical protein
MVALGAAVLAVARPHPTTAQADGGNAPQILAPTWNNTIRQWAPLIDEEARRYRLDPDLIAAVIQEESNGHQDVVSRVGAVGLMGVMPSRPGLEWRPSGEALLDPERNLRWGTAILTEIIRQSGGDIFAALAAYSGGWEQVENQVPRQYAASVLDNYGRAVAARNGVSPQIASQWTIAIEMRRGHVTPGDLLVLGEQPVSGLRTYGRHVIYEYPSLEERPFRLIGHAVPVALIVPLAGDSKTQGRGDQVDLHLQARLGNDAVKIQNSNPQVLLACLPSLSRLRGRVSTRWYAPSDCPHWHR